ncbi:DUF3662 domain-containing protein [Actinoplanes sp. LDG1-06]|uniref:DUF3662 domain-containing protein n=1 Tax=Paractinoplanes ovalisporus TaxID=2810368 RepID=A0ABS2ATB5_9ACTN|nr:DUF3662 and FHA domain-containing protein [Actinoplanes ovalisporus]MBM2623090.1 DUF3662 domain-containing protein [Actinoplanes ovalisporus]
MTAAPERLGLEDIELHSVVRPESVLEAMRREAERHKALLGEGRTLVPNRYTVGLSEYDHRRWAPHAAQLAQDLAVRQAELIADQAWIVYGDVSVEVFALDDLDTGTFRVAALLEPDPPPLVRAVTPGDEAVVTLVSAEGQRWPLPAGLTVLGRDRQSGVRLRDPGVSRRHLIIEVTPDRITLTDLGSHNGTRVNGHPVATVDLRPGDVIFIGGTQLTLRSAS